MVGGWTAQNRTGIEWVDVNGDDAPELVSATNGVWNHVTVFDAGGAPLHNAQFGPGPNNRPYETMRDMSVADLDGDGDMEIVVAISEGLVVALDHECRKVWATRLPSSPTQLEVITPAGGEIVGLGAAGGRVDALLTLTTARGKMAMAVTATGAVQGFAVD